MSIDLSRHAEFALITINRPEALNALNLQMVGDIGKAIDAVAATDARAVFFIGAGEKAFCAGADIGELVGRDLAAIKRDGEFGQATFAKLDTLAIPSFAILNGFAFGGGLELAMACTFRVATAGAKMGQPEIKLGAIPGYGGTQRLPRLIGESRAMELIMSGRTIEAEEAERIGLVNRLVEGDPITAAAEFARTFTGYSLSVLHLAREAVRRAADTPLNEGLKIEADLATIAFQTKDSEEGTTAFMAKRKPVFKDA